MMFYVAGSCDRSDVNHLLPGRVCKTSPGKPEQTQGNQDNPQYLIHGASVADSRQSQSTLILNSLL